MRENINFSKRPKRKNDNLLGYIRTDTMSEYFISIATSAQNMSLNRFVEFYKNILVLEYLDLPHRCQNTFNSLSRGAISHLIQSDKPVYVYLGVVVFQAFKVCESDKSFPTNVYMPEFENYLKDVLRTKLRMLEGTPNICKYVRGFIWEQ